MPTWRKDMTKQPIIFIDTSCIADWVKWRRCVVELSYSFAPPQPEAACVHVNLREMRATGYDFVQAYIKALPHLWASPDSLFICVNEKGEETGRYYMGKKITEVPDPYDTWGEDQNFKQRQPNPLWWQKKQSAERTKQEALIALRNELRQMIGWKL